MGFGGLLGKSTTTYTDEEILSPSVKSQLGLGADSVPSDAFALLGQTMASGARIVTGSYVGTGQSGPSNPNILDFDEPPKIIFIVPKRNSASCSMGILFPPYGAKTFIFGPDIQDHYRGLTVSLSGGTVKYYSSEDYSYQLNNSGEVFHYYALF